MKKIKLIMAFMALLSFSEVFAQQGEIIYRDFDPDSILIYWHKLGPVWIDLDADGEADDIKMQMWIHGSICAPELVTADSKIKICTIEENNTDIILSEVEEENWKTFVSWSGPNGCDAIRYKYYGFRIQHEDSYYYGWFETYSSNVSKKYGFDRTAFCTIPDYPLRWGQTDMVGIGENENHHAKLHPNPTTGLVHIEDVECAEVQVYNALGQQLKTVQNTNEVSLVGLPQGVYLLRVTLKDGKVFSDKVVKE